MSTNINFVKRLGVPSNTNILIGLIPPLVNAFKARVAADGGTFEAETCLLNQLTALNNIA
jgi:hypothetical protein